MIKVLNYTVKKLLGFLVLQSEINQDTLFYYNFFITILGTSDGLKDTIQMLLYFAINKYD